VRVATESAAARARRCFALSPPVPTQAPSQALPAARVRQMDTGYATRRAACSRRASARRCATAAAVAVRACCVGPPRVRRRSARATSPNDSPQRRTNAQNASAASAPRSLVSPPQQRVVTTPRCNARTSRHSDYACTLKQTPAGRRGA